MRNEPTKTIVALIAISQYAQAQEKENCLAALDHSADQQTRLRTLFESPRYRDAGFEVLVLEPFSSRGDVLNRLEQVGNLARSDPSLNVVLIWSGHGRTFDRKLRLATPDSTKPLHEATGLPAAEIVIQSGAKVANHFCVFIDACEAGGSALEFSEVAAARAWNDAETTHSFAAYCASYPFVKAEDGFFLSLVASILEEGPSKEAEKKARDEWDNFAFNVNDRKLSAEAIGQGIAAQFLVNGHMYHGSRPPGATVFGRQSLFLNPWYQGTPRARMVDEEALGSHFLPKARGIEFAERGWHFTGRVQATQEILRWATAEPGTTTSVYVLTGGAGTGKSALVGRLIALSDPQTRERLQREGWKEEKDQALGTLPPLNLIDAAVHLRNLTAQDAVKQLAELLKLTPPISPEAFVETIRKHNDAAKFIVFDALDEAEDPLAVALRVIRPLAELGWRVLVASRRASLARGAKDLLGALADVSGEPQELDADLHAVQDIKAYVVGRITVAQLPQFIGQASLIEMAGAKIAERAHGKFLYARIATSNLIRCDEDISEQTLDELLGDDIGGVFEMDLRTLDRAFQRHFKRNDKGSTRLLEALAWAQGSGIPIRDGLWVTVANALTYLDAPGTAVRFEVSHVHWILREGGRYILEDGDGEQAVYRLFHQYFIDYFHPRAESEVDTARVIAEALGHLVDELGGWRHANPYLVRHMAGHWAACRPQSGLHDLLLNFEWIRARLEDSGIQALLRDYDEFVNEPVPQAIAQVAATLSMTAHILLKAPRQLIPQLLGRLPQQDEQIQSLCQAARRAIDRVMLIPRLGGLRQSGALTRIIEADRQVLSVAFSRDNTYLVSGGNEGAVRLWNVRNGQPVGPPLLGHKGSVNHVAFSQDGIYVVSGGVDGTVRLWDVHSGKQMPDSLGEHEKSVLCVAFNHDGTRVVSGGSDGTVRLWDTHDRREIGDRLKRHAQRSTSVAFSPDGTRVVSGGTDRTVRLWDSGSGQPIDLLAQWNGKKVLSVAFSRDGTRLVAGGEEGMIRLWNAHSGQFIGDPLPEHAGTVSSVDLDEEGSRLLSGGTDGIVRLWDVGNGQPLCHPLHRHEDWVTCVAFNTDGSRAVSGGLDGKICLFDTRKIQPAGVPLFENMEEVTSVAISPDGTRVVSGGKRGTVRLWDVCSGQLIGKLLYEHKRPVNCVAFTRNGTHLVSGDAEGTIRLWDVSNGRLLSGPLPAHDFGVTCVTFNSDGTRLLSGGADGVVLLWNVGNGQSIGDPLLEYEGPVSSVVFGPDGIRAVTGDGTRPVLLWDVGSGQPIGDPLYKYGGGVWCSAFSPDGTQMVSGGMDGKVTLWDARRGKALGVLHRHTGPVWRVAFSQDGIYVVSGGIDGTVRLWISTTGQSVESVYLDASVTAVAVDTQNMHHVIAGQRSGQLVFLDMIDASDHSGARTTT